MVPQVSFDLPAAKRTHPLQRHRENGTLQGKQHSGQKLNIAHTAVSELPAYQINAAYQAIYTKNEKAVLGTKSCGLSGQSPKSLLRIGITGYERTDRRIQAQYGKAYRHIIKPVKLAEHKW